MKKRILVAVAGSAATAGVIAWAAADVVSATVYGCISAFVIAAAVLAEYTTLVNVRRNPGAKRLAGLLLAIVLLLGATIARYFIPSFLFRTELQAWLFWALAAALAYLGWHIWRDQVEGAKARRARRDQNHPEKEDTPL